MAVYFPTWMDGNASTGMTFEEHVEARGQIANSAAEKL